MPGRKRCCCSGVPKAMITGATITGPNGTTRGAPASAHSSSNRCFCTAFQPGPPNCLGQAQPSQPFAPRMRAQRCRSSAVRRSALCTLWLMSFGRFSATQSRICSAERLFFGSEVQVHRRLRLRCGVWRGRVCSTTVGGRARPSRDKARSQADDRRRRHVAAALPRHRGALALGQLVCWAALFYAFTSFVLPMQRALGWSEPR